MIIKIKMPVNWYDESIFLQTMNLYRVLGLNCRYIVYMFRSRNLHQDF